MFWSSLEPMLLFVVNGTFEKNSEKILLRQLQRSFRETVGDDWVFVCQVYI